MNTEQVLTRLNIDPHSRAIAVQQVREMIENSPNPLGAAKVLFDNLTTGVQFTFTDTNEARLTVAKLVEQAIVLGDQFDPTQELKRAAEWIVHHRETNPWAFTRPDNSTVDSETQHREGVNVQVKTDGKLKKGSKQILAKALFDNNPTLDNKALIQLFMKELDMTKAGATTYNYNVRKAAKS